MLFFTDIFKMISINIICVVGFFYIDLNKVDACADDENKPWSYNDSLPNGPSKWHLKFPDCGGQMQSPISTENLEQFDDQSSSAALITTNNYDNSISKYNLLNNGYTVLVTPKDDVIRSVIINNDKEYFLEKIQFHWGSSQSQGAEHQHKNWKFAGEVQLVHSNSNKEIAIIAVLYSEQTEAAQYVDGQLVKQLSNRNQFDRTFKDVIKRLQNVKYKNDEIEVDGNIDLKEFAEDLYFSASYMGSFTTPPCTEGIRWILPSDYKTLSTTKFEAFRSLCSNERNLGDNSSDCPLVNNYRPLQHRDHITYTYLFDKQNLVDEFNKRNF